MLDWYTSSRREWFIIVSFFSSYCLIQSPLITCPWIVSRRIPPFFPVYAICCVWVIFVLAVFVCEHGGNADSCGRVDQLTRLLQHRQLLTHYIKINKIKRNIWGKKKEIKKEGVFKSSVFNRWWLAVVVVGCAVLRSTSRLWDILNLNKPVLPFWSLFPPLLLWTCIKSLEILTPTGSATLFPLRRIVNHPNLKSFKKILDLGRALMNLLSRITFFEISFSFLNVLI